MNRNHLPPAPPVKTREGSLPYVLLGGLRDGKNEESRRFWRAITRRGVYGAIFIALFCAGVALALLHGGG